MEQSLSLNQLLTNVSASLKREFSSSYWVRAEISELYENQNGHCFLELIEKEEHSLNVKARCKASIWAYSYRMIKPYFETTTGTSLAVGMNVLVNVIIEFHESFGFSLQVRNIDPSYTMGEMALARKKTIAQLEEDGVFEMNKELTIENPAQRIAIIASASSAGYGDFINHITQNKYGYVLYPVLFNALVQGAEAPYSIIEAFEKIYNHIDNFDLVVLIRGGGSSTDLSCFDNYDLAYFITQFPIPVITGIGHDRDESVVDMVAHTALKTPTAVANYLIDELKHSDDYAKGLFERILQNVSECIVTEKSYLDGLFNAIPQRVRLNLLNEDNRLKEIAYKFKETTGKRMHKEQRRLQKSSDKLIYETPFILRGEKARLSEFQQKLKQAVERRVTRSNQELDSIEKQLRLADPKNILKRGFTMTYVNGKIAKSSSELKQGDAIETLFKDGTVTSTVHPSNSENTV